MQLYAVNFIQLLSELSSGIKLTTYSCNGDRGGTVVKVLRLKSEGRWFDSKWCHWIFSLT
jgi:hypothetical protein